ncbi:holin [Bifidobacterium pseudolongum subsp. globosum]|uniref:Holin n=1 Tax=Bifidobacterium pseudolongum subsp. globosum TaxID=1690 RepID=A0A4Q5AKM4_9BIFI|nr:holin [Bifidobacterium pseudolongum]RYQ21404.1 holin [Bifidobacterium pseudolongum subsp. globosum]RYQ29970.1 holin [Bifidobacterium pseudolongum subsp. globosum]
MSEETLDNLNDHPTPDDSDQPLPDSLPTREPTPSPTRVWVRAALIRALKTMAQAAIGVLGTGAIGLMQADWMNVLSVALMGGVLSVLTSIAGIPEVDGGDSLASITDTRD